MPRRKEVFQKHATFFQHRHGEPQPVERRLLDTILCMRESAASFQRVLNQSRQGRDAFAPAQMPLGLRVMPMRRVIDL